MSECVLPGCKQPVNEAGDTCTDCLAAFGTWLQPSDIVLTADEIRSRDAYVERAYHAQRGTK
jgi:hypothetical protein